MATLNVGAMAARLGLDPAEFLTRMKGVQGFNGFVSAEMARQWKRSGRDGQEGIRLIDEALGIHVARPVARILSETFPALGKALGSILPGIAFSALGFAIIEMFDHVTKKMEEAKKKEEEYQQAVQKTKIVIGEADAASEMRLDKALAKAATLRGDQKSEAHFKGLIADAEAVDQMAKMVDKLTEAELREARANLARMTIWAAAGRIAHSAFTSAATIGIEDMNARMETFAREFSLRAPEDRINHTTTAATLLAEEARKAREELAKMQASAVVEPEPGKVARTQSYAAGFTPEQIANAQRTVDIFKAIEEANVRRDKAADQEKKNDIVEAGKRYAEQVRNEIAAIQKKTEVLKAAASAAVLAAEATGKGTQASIQAAAAAQAEKEILDTRAEADSKLDAAGKKISGNAGIQRALAAHDAEAKHSALIEQTAKATQEYNRALAEFVQRTQEHVATLDAEAAGVGRVAAEQAKQAEGLMKLEELRKGAGASSAGLEAARAGIAIEQAKTQTTAFAKELQKAHDAAIAASDPTPWNRTEAKLAALKTEFSLNPDQMAQLGAGMHGADAAGEVQKLVEQAAELAAVHNALLAGSPYAALETQVQKLAKGYHLAADGVRAMLILHEQMQSRLKAVEAVSAMDPSGAQMQGLAIQRDELEKLAEQWRQIGKDVSPITLELQRITAEEDAILLKTGNVGDGFRAWLNALQVVESNGKFIFDALSSASKGFEETAAHSIIAIVETHKNQHIKLIHELRAMWESYFAGLAKMGLEYGMKKVLADIPGLAKLGGVGAGGSAATGASSLNTAGGRLIAAAAALQTAARTLGGGGIPIPGGGGGGGAAANAADVPGMMAEGGDVTPGGSFISGEAGAERVDLSRAGGAHVTPLGFKTGGGDTYHNYDLRGAVVTDDLLRKAEGAQMMQHTEGRAVARAVSMTQEIARRSRPPR